MENIQSLADWVLFVLLMGFCFVLFTGNVKVCHPRSYIWETFFSEFYLSLLSHFRTIDEGGNSSPVPSSSYIDTIFLRILFIVWTISRITKMRSYLNLGIFF